MIPSVDDVTPAYLDVRQSARYLCVSVELLELWRSRGDGPRFMKLHPGKHGKIIYAKAALDAFMATKLQPARR